MPLPTRGVVRRLAHSWILVVALTGSLTSLSAQSDERSDAPRRPDRITVPNHPAAAELCEVTTADGRIVPGYRLSLDGVEFAPPKPTSYDLLLRYRRFDPLQEAPNVPEKLAANASQRLHVVQYWTQGIEAYRDAMRRSGVVVHGFLANHANIVEVDPAAVDAIRALPFVRAVVPFHPAYKLEFELRDVVTADVPGRVRVNLLTTRRGPAGQEPVLDWVRTHGGVVEHVSAETFLISVTLDVRLLPGLAALDAVQWIDRWGPIEDDMDVARAFHGADYVETSLGLTGQGVRVEVLDGGCETGHPDLQNFSIHSPNNTPSSHGTACSGIVLGSGFGNAAARGAMPSAHLVIGDYQSLAGSRYAHSQDLQDTGQAWQCVLQTNSWGNSRRTTYTSISQDMDLILFDLQRLSILQSQSNAGDQNSRPQAWAKNIIAVGGVRHNNTVTKADDAWNFGASIGPAADGRIKPDLASFYDNILCTDRVGSAGYSSTNYTSSFGGTSGATPIVAGHLGLFYQLWHNGQFGNATPGATVFDNRPNNTFAKAMLINTATQWTFSGTSHDLTRVHQGWGHPDLQRMLDLAGEMFLVDESDVLTNLQSTTYSIDVAAATPALKVTMVYRDPPGTTSSSLHRINNLDLEVTAPDATVYHGNQGLLANMWSTPGGSPNDVDTVENVFVQNPAAGTWLVTVTAAELNQDAHVETGAVDADYALVVSGGTEATTMAPAAPGNLAATANALSIDLGWDDNSGVEDGFEIERSVSGGAFSLLTTLGPDVTTYTDSGLAPGTPHDYRVRAYNNVGPSAYSNTAGATTLALPTAPTGLSATANVLAIDLAWADNATLEDDYEIERSVGGGAFALLTTLGPDATSYTDSNLTPGETYDYRVRATNAAGPSAYSNTAGATTLALPTAPTGLSATTTSATQIDLTWVDNATVEDDFELERRISGGGSFTLVATLPAGTTNYVDAGLPTGTSFDYRVRATNAAGASGYSNVATAMTPVVPPAAPTNLAATSNAGGAIDLTWTDESDNEDGFEIQRSLDANGGFTTVATVPAGTTAFTDGGLPHDTRFYYRVRATNTAGSSAFTNTASAFTSL